MGNDRTSVSIPEARAAFFNNAFCASGISLLAINPRLTPWATDISALQAFCMDNPGGDGMLIEMIAPLKSTGGRERDVMDDDVIAAGMQHVQMIADSKHRSC